MAKDSHDSVTDSPSKASYGSGSVAGSGTSLSSHAKAAKRTSSSGARSSAAPDASQESETSEYAVRLLGISKHFGLIQANKNINLDIPRGTIHGIIGENGAGKSTLMSILYGFYQPDEGEIELFGRLCKIHSPIDAISQGIGMVFQHFMLVEAFTVIENLALGGRSGWNLNQSTGQIRQQVRKINDLYGLSVDLDAVIDTLPVGVRQRVEVLKALVRGAKILILDEPTGVLTPQEADQLFEILDALKKNGVTVVLITHKLREIMHITDNVHVLRGGEIVAQRVTAKTNTRDLAALMVGRSLEKTSDLPHSKAGDVALRARDLRVCDESGHEVVHGVSLSVRKGEIVGIAGVSGNGQSALLNALSGRWTAASGEIMINGQTLGVDVEPSPSVVRSLGVAYIPEDRVVQGLVSEFSLAESFLLGCQDDAEFLTAGFVQRLDHIDEECTQALKNFDVRGGDAQTRTQSLSGGNQQKLVIARELRTEPEVLLVGQPTRGVDIGAIEFIHQKLMDKRSHGCAILLVSVELDEVMELSDRILVMFDGRVVGELERKDFDKHVLGSMMTDTYTDTTDTNTRDR